MFCTLIDTIASLILFLYKIDFAAYEPPPQVCPDCDGSPLELGCVITGWLVIIFGVLASFFVLMLEIAQKYIWKGNRNSRTRRPIGPATIPATATLNVDANLGPPVETSILPPV